MTDQDDWDLAIGQLVRWTALLDSVVMILLSGLAGTDQRVTRTLMTDSPSRALDHAAQLVDFHIAGTELAAAVKAELSSAKAALTDRNMYVHSVWVSVDGERRWRSNTKPLKPQTHRTVADLQMAVATMLERAEALMGMMGSLRSHGVGEWGDMVGSGPPGSP